ncbi:hypothetical protein ACX6FB_002561 [Vibrio cholerae]
MTSKKEGCFYFEIDCDEIKYFIFYVKNLGRDIIEGDKMTIEEMCNSIIRRVIREADFTFNKKEYGEPEIGKITTYVDSEACEISIPERFFLNVRDEVPRR